MATKALLKHQSYYIRGLLTERVETLSRLLDNGFMGSAAKKEIEEIDEIMVRLIGDPNIRPVNEKEIPMWNEDVYI